MTSERYEDGYLWVGPFASPDTYRIVSNLGGGGEGEVWRATLPLSEAGQRSVAVKIMPVTGVAEEAESWDRFGHLLKSLSHPGLVRVTDVFLGPAPHRRGGMPAGGTTFRFAVMDYVDGISLRDWVIEHPEATATQRLNLLRTVASALDEMHSGRQTVVPVAHGDVKPANIVITTDAHQITSSVLVDLGLTRLADAIGQQGRSHPYAAPELRASEAQATPEADAFAFGVTMAHALIGQQPPTDAEGFVDVQALETLLQSNSLTAQRPMLGQQIIRMLGAPAAQRPRDLRRWLDSATESLSVTVAPPTADTSRPSRSQEATQLSPPPPDTIPVSDPAPSPHRRKAVLIAAAIVVLVVAAGGAFALLRKTDDGGQAHPPGPATTLSATTPSLSAPTSSTTSSTTTTTISSRSSATALSSSPTAASSESLPSEPATTASTTSAAASTLPSNTFPQTTQWVSEMRQVDYDQAAQIGSNPGRISDLDTYSTNGTTYPHSIRMVSGSNNYDGGTFWQEFDLARQWSTLSGVVGVDDSSAADASMTWQVFGDGQLLASGDQHLGTSTQLNIPVKGVLRLRMVIIGPVHSDDPKPAVVWGSPKLTA